MEQMLLSSTPLFLKPLGFMLKGFFLSLETFHIKIRKTWWFETFYMFISKIGEDEPFLTSIFFKGVGSTTT